MMRRRAAWQRKRGLRAEQLSLRQIRHAEPAVDGTFTAGFLFPTEAQVDNVVLMQALAAAISRSGVVVREHAVVRRFIIRRNAIAGVETTTGRIEAPVVVNCLGSWADMGGRFPIRLPVEPARGQMMRFDGPKRLLRHAVISARAYAVQRRDSRILVGSTIERVGFQKQLTLDGMHHILCGLRRISSTLHACAFREAWAGFRPYSRTGRPLLGETPVRGLYVATGHFRHGILLAPITAQVMADLILTGRSRISLADFRVPGRAVKQA
jgi:glycine oxidase